MQLVWCMEVCHRSATTHDEKSYVHPTGSADHLDVCSRTQAIPNIVSSCHLVGKQLKLLHEAH